MKVVLAMAFVKHIVMFRLKEESKTSDFETVYKALQDLPKEIPQIKKFELGKDMLLPAGQNHPAGPNRQVAWVLGFESVADYEAYDQSPVHKAFLSDILLPRIEPGSRSAIQYEVDEL